MPIDVSEIENRIFLLKWHGDVTIDEVEESHEIAYQMAVEKGYKAYIHILDGSDIKTYPIDPPRLWQVLMKHDEAFAILVINAPTGGVTLARMLNRMTTRVTLQDFNSLEEAISGAHRLLEQRRAGVFEL